MYGKLLFLLALCCLIPTLIHAQIMPDISSFISKPRNYTRATSCMDNYVSALVNQEMWALTMFDATSKLQSGILSGNIYNTGDFDECIEIEVPNSSYIGQHCIAKLHVDMQLPATEKVAKAQYGTKLMQNLNRRLFLQQRDVNAPMLNGIGLSWAACVPSQCTYSDVEDFFNTMLVQNGLPFVQLEFSETYCQTKDTMTSSQELSGGAIAVICIFSLLLAIVIASTIYDVYLCYTNGTSISPLLIAFSLYTNGSKLLSVSKSNEQLSCINGIRVISMAWIILGHGYSAFIAGGVTNTVEMFDWFQRDYSMYLVGATVSVDSFFVISGLLMAYGFLNAVYKGIPFNIFQYYIHRYIRLTPALLALMVFNITLLDYSGNGPLWPFYIPFYTGCKEWWWTNMLYIQNYVNEQTGVVTCLPQTWYLAIDMQLFLLSPFLLIPLCKWPKYAMYFLGALIIISIAIPFGVAYGFEITASLFAPADKQVDYQSRIYIATESRAAPWLLGVGLGYIIYRIKITKKTFSMNRLVAMLLSAGSLAVLATCVFAGHDMNFKEYDRFEFSAYIAFVRPAWSLALCWIIFACIQGYLAPINAILSIKPFQIMTRLTYSMYLLHVNVQLMMVYQRRTSIRFTDYMAMFYFWGFYVVTATIAAIWVLLFESPMITIEKLLFSKSIPKVKSTDNNGNI